jgi:peptide chain release factor 2
VIKEVDETINIQLDDKDLEISFHRSNGNGGQNINKVSTAVRVKYIPTGTVVNCQSERYQHRNKEEALLLLKSKLYQMMLEQKKQTVKELRKEQSSIAFGQKDRTYSFHPSEYVIDHRTKKKSTNLKKILDGDLELIW